MKLLTARVPELVKPQLGAGALMLLKTLGVDPDELFGMMADLDRVVRTTVAEVSDRSQRVAEQIDSIQIEQVAEAEQMAAMSQRLDSIESSLKVVCESLAVMHLTLGRIEKAKAHK